MSGSRLLFSLWILTLLPSSAVGDEPPRPNIVLILADDLGFSDLGCYGGEIRTPNLDRLAAEGMQFTQFYNCAVCVTTRAALLTGLHPRRKDGELLHPNMITLAEVLRSAGYRTSLTGKWHLGAQQPRRPLDRGFEEYYGVASGCCSYFDPSRPDPVFYNGGQRRPFFHNNQLITEFPEGYYTTDAFAEHAAGQIRRWAADEAPYFVHVAFTAPHFPLHAKPEDIARYEGRYAEGYFALRQQRFERLRQRGILDLDWKLSEPDKRLGDFRYDYSIAPWENVQDRPREERRMEVYAAMVDSLDQAVGRILRAVDESGEADQTLVMFLSDNGGCASFPGYSDPERRRGREQYNRALPGGVETYDFVAPGWGWAQCAPFRRYKVWTYEGGIATPFLARWPAGIPAGRLNATVGHVVDLMPTLLELGGAAYPSARGDYPLPALDGLSLVDAFDGNTIERDEPLYWALFGNRAIRDGRWKLVWGVTGRQWELYDMLRDRTETTDLAARQPERVEAMSRQWTEWWESLDADR